MKNYALRKHLKNSVLLLEEDCKVMSDTHVAYMVIALVLFGILNIILYT